MPNVVKRAAVIFGLLLLVAGASAVGASAVLFVNGKWHAASAVRAPATAVSSATLTATATPSPTPKPTPTPLPRPQPTPTPPPTLLIFDCASAISIDRVQRSWSLTLCLRTNPARPFYAVSYNISSCGQAPGTGPDYVSTHLDYAGKQTVPGVTVHAACDPPFTFRLTPYALQTDASAGITYPIQGSATINVAS